MPAISEALRPTGVELLWIIDVYPLVLAGLLIPMGALGDRYGRRRILLIGAIGFALVSAVAEFAPTASWLIAARAATGLFGSMLLPATLALIRVIFSEARDRRLAIAIWSAVFSGGAAAGPIVGGMLLEWFGWTAILLIGAPIALLFALLAPWLVPESRDPDAGPVDLASALLAIATMVALVYGVKSLATGGEPLLAAGALLASGLLGWWFARRQRALAQPMLDLTLFRTPAFSGGLLINILSNAAIVGMMFMATQHLQVVSGIAPTLAGLALLPGTIMAIVSSLSVPVIADRIGSRRAEIVAFAVATAGFAVVAVWGASTAAWPFIVGLAVLGAGLGIAWTVSTDLVISSAPVAKAGAASAASETGFEIGVVFGTAAIGGLTTALYQAFFAVPAGVPAADADAARETIGAAAAIAESLGGPAGAGLRDAAVAAFTQAERWTSIGVALVLLAATLVLAVTGRTRRVRRRRPIGPVHPRDAE
ncbi:MAG: MFS transporter [Microbacteriaceae bacterium]|nr:MFS transporter [Microbacteriaceae bacterium]